MNIEDILVKIKFASEEQKEKGMLGFAKVRIRIKWGNIIKHLVIKGFTIRRSEYKDKFGGYRFVLPPAVPTGYGKYMSIIFFEDEKFIKDKDWWSEIADRILEEYHRETKNKNHN